MRKVYATHTASSAAWRAHLIAENCPPEILEAAVEAYDQAPYHDLRFGAKP